MQKKKTTLAQAMLDFRVNVDSVTKDSTNPYFNSDYTSYNAVRETINPTLDMLGIVVIQAPMILEGIDVLNTKVYMAHNPSDFICSNIGCAMMGDTRGSQYWSWTTMSACLLYYLVKLPIPERCYHCY